MNELSNEETLTTEFQISYCNKVAKSKCIYK
jgi:hypothetical protein